MTVETLEYAPWYGVKELLRAVTAIRRINFAIVEQRQQALERLGNLDSEAPFGLSSRFASPGNYVCEIEGDWARKFMQLKSALSYKAGEKDDKLVKQQGTAPDSQKALDYNDSLQAFWNSTTAMYDQCRRNDGVLDRATFEHKFNLHWGGSPPKPPPKEGAARRIRFKGKGVSGSRSGERDEEEEEIDEEEETEETEAARDSSSAFRSS